MAEGADEVTGVDMVGAGDVADVAVDDVAESAAVEGPLLVVAAGLCDVAGVGGVNTAPVVGGADVAAGDVDDVCVRGESDESAAAAAVDIAVDVEEPGGVARPAGVANV